MDFRKSTGRSSFVPRTPQARPSTTSYSLGNRGTVTGTAQRPNRPSLNRNSLFSVNRPSRGSEGRFSLAGAGGAPPSSVKRSSAMPQSRFAEKDTRPLASKDYQQGIIERIRDYLCNVDVELPFEPDSIKLNAPSKPTVRVLFEFLYQKLDPDWQRPDPKDSARFDSQFMNVFAQLGYPFPLKNSQMQTMTAPHTWPHILAALDWLLGFVQIDECVNQSALEVDDPRARAEYSFFTAGFKKWKSGDQDATHELQLFRDFLMPTEDLEREMDELRAQTQADNNEAAQLAEQLQDEQQEIRAREQEEQNYETDIARLEEFVASSNEQIAVFADDSRNILTELQKQKEELEQVQKDNNGKEQIIRGQKISGDEARQLVAQKRMLNEQLHEKNEHWEDVKAKLDRAQQAVWKRKNALRDRYRDFALHFEEMARELPVQLEEAVLAFVEEVNPASPTFLSENHPQLVKQVRRLKDVLQDFRTHYRKNMNAAGDLVTQLNSQCVEFQRENSAMQQNGEVELESLQREYATVEPKVQELSYALQKCQQKMEVAKRGYQTVSEENAKRRDDLAVLEQRYVQKKGTLDLRINERTARVIDALDKIYSYMEELNDEDQQLRELGETLLKSGTEELDRILAKKSQK